MPDQNPKISFLRDKNLISKVILMNSKAQVSMEYLMTYGWVLVLIATVVSVLVFIVSSPVPGVTFSSSDPTKILVSSVGLDGTNAVGILKNITGGRINITLIFATPGGFLPCTVNDVPGGWN